MNKYDSSLDMDISFSKDLSKCIRTGYLIGLVISLGFHLPTLPHPNESAPQQPFNFTAFNFPCPPQTLALVKKSRLCAVSSIIPSNSLWQPQRTPHHSWHTIPYFTALSLHMIFSLSKEFFLSPLLPPGKIPCHQLIPNWNVTSETWCNRLVPVGLLWYSVFYHNICPIIVLCAFHVYFVD